MWNENYTKDWWAKYIGKPWAAVPNPPESYTCGELVRAIYKDIHDIDAPPMHADPTAVREYIMAMKTPTMYALRPREAHEAPEEFDVVMLFRGNYADHIGVLVYTNEGPLVMHCQQGAGVTVDSASELVGAGWRAADWYRYIGRPHA